MKYTDYVKYVTTEEEVIRYQNRFEKDIKEKQDNLTLFLEQSKQRLEYIDKCEENKELVILGRTFKNGRDKSILLIIRYPDDTQRDERYTFSKIANMRSKLAELKEKYSGNDWSNFEEEI